LAETLPLLNKPLFHLFGEKAPGPQDGPMPDLGNPVIEGFFLNGSEPYLRSVMRNAEAVPIIERYFAEKNIGPRPAEELLKDR
jgi:hypothetical protein